MADKYYNSYYNGNNGDKIYLELHVYTVATSVANNTTTERADLYAYVKDASYGWYNLYGTEAFIGINGNNTTKTVNFDYRSTGVKNLISTWDTVIKHNNDGTAKGVGISAHHYSGVGLGNASISSTYDCDTIDRKATSNQSLNSKTETTIKMNWSSDSTIDYIWYSKDNGSNWTGVDVTDGKSGTYTITGLSANTSYNIKTRVRRKDSQLTTDSSALAVKTFSYPKQGLVRKTETSISMNWSADSTVDMIYYSTDNGSTWSSGISVNATSGIYSIEGLTSYTNYKIKTRVRRKATQTLSNTSATSVTTYQFPYVTKVGTADLTIGNSQTLTLYNPLLRDVEVFMYQNDTGIRLYAGGTMKDSITFTPDASTMYSSIPNSTDGKCYYYCVYRGEIKAYKNGTYKIKGTEKPTFTNFTYNDGDTVTTALTGNNQILVKSLSDVNVIVTAANKAVGKNSATIKKYRVKIGNQTTEMAYSSSSTVSAALSNVTTGTIQVTAIDSRGLETTVTKTATFKNWTKPVFNTVKVDRENGIGTTGLLNLKVSFWNANFGAVANQITKFSYRYKKSTDSSYSTFIDITNRMTKNNNGYYINASNAFLPVTDESTTATVFEVGYEYNIQFACVDKSEIVVYSNYITLNSGIPCTAKQKNSDGTYSIGINKLPDSKYALDLKGDVNIEDNNGLSINGEYTITKDSDGSIYICASNTKGNPPIVFRPKGLESGSGQAYLTGDGYLKLVGGLSTEKNITVTRGTTEQPKVEVSNGSVGASLMVGSGGTNRGIWDDTLGKWMIYSDGTNITVNGMALQVYNTQTNPTAETWYTIPFISGTPTGAYGIRANNGMRYRTLEGTASVNGYGNLMLGNGTSYGTAGNKYGIVELYSTGSGSCKLKAKEQITGGYSAFLPAENGEIQLKPTQLYNNATGTNGTVTLSQTAANFTYLEIFFYRTSWNYYNSTRVYSPNGKIANLVTISRSPTSSNYFNLGSKNVTISGTSITVKEETSTNVVNGGSTSVADGKSIYISRVIGYK